MEKQTPEQKFLKDYDKLCKKHGLLFSLSPKYVLNDKGEYITKLEISISKLK